MSAFEDRRAAHGRGCIGRLGATRGARVGELIGESGCATKKEWALCEKQDLTHGIERSRVPMIDRMPLENYIALSKLARRFLLQYGISSSHVSGLQGERHMSPGVQNSKYMRGIIIFLQGKNYRGWFAVRVLRLSVPDLGGLSAFP